LLFIESETSSVFAAGAAAGGYAGHKLGEQLLQPTSAWPRWCEQ
jgi:hypothetical protein